MAADGLTVTVTGPTGDLGIALVDSLERSRKVKKIVGMARRPFDPASQGWKKTEYREGDVQDRKSVEDAVKGADVIVHLAFAILESSDRTRGREHRRLAERVRGGGRGRRGAHLLRVERRRLRLPRGQPELADGGRPAARQRRPLLLRAEGRGRGRPRRGPAEDRADEGVGLPAVHRRRPEGPDADGGDPLRPDVAGDAGRRPAAPERDAGPEARDPGPRRPVPARPRGRCGAGVRGRRAGQGRARPVQPRRQRQADDVRPGRRARLVHDPDPGARGRRHGGGHRRACR